MNNAEQVVNLANEFTKLLSEELTPDQMQSVIKMNRDDNWTVCHSHDFTDAGQVMLDAFSNVFGRDADPMEDTIMDVSWSFAKNTDFSQLTTHRGFILQYSPLSDCCHAFTVDGDPKFSTKGDETATGKGAIEKMKIKIDSKLSA